VKQPWWRDAEEAAQLVSSLVGAAAAQAAKDGTYDPPPGAPQPRRRRKAGSLRHFAEVIRADRLAPGVSVDKDIVAGVLAGDLRYVTDPIAVVAVAAAAHKINGTPFPEDEAERLRVACVRVAELVERAREADRRAPSLVPAMRPGSDVAPPDPPVIDAYFTTRRPRRRALPWVIGSVAAAALTVGGFFVFTDKSPTADGACRDGAAPAEIIDVPSTVFKDDEATRLSPTLDFDQMNGSARYARYQGRTYYWGRAGSDDHAPAAGGSRVRWKTPDGRWRSCAVALAVSERDYVRSPAVATTIGGEPVTIQVCLWRDSPRRENCTPEIATG
jgi:hypothetical protein